MIDIHNDDQYYIVFGKTDLRKGIDTLAIYLETTFDQDPFDGGYYLFCGTRKDRFKVLHWDGEGFQLTYKRYENGKLPWPPSDTPRLERVTTQEIKRFLQGYPLRPSIQKSEKKDMFSLFFCLKPFIIKETTQKGRTRWRNP